MENLDEYLTLVIETSGIFAPLLFIALHIIRPIFFIPVVLLCILGGLVFGIIPGIALSIIGITLSSMIFFFMANSMPSTTARLFKMKKKLIGRDTQMTTGQIAVLRLIPFIHFHLLSFLIYESSKQFKDYFRSSLVANVPVAIIYTVIGQSISNFSPLHSTGMLVGIVPFLYFFRRKEITFTIREFLS